MPEIKNTFIQGKMNKDLDERLVPNGQYRHAENIEVSSAEDSDVGTIKNVLGNYRVEDKIGADYTCVGSIADEKNNKLYWFVSTYNKDAIYEYDVENDITLPVLVDKKGGTVNAVLNFSGNIITGINILDDLLLWTDNNSEPKKINIKDCKAGTDPNGQQHTQLIFENGSFEGVTLDKVSNGYANDFLVDRPPSGKLFWIARDPFLKMTGGVDINGEDVATGGFDYAYSVNPGYVFSIRHYRDSDFLGIKEVRYYGNTIEEVTAGGGSGTNGTVGLLATGSTDDDFQVGDIFFGNDVRLDIEEKHVTVIKPKPLNILSTKINHEEDFVSTSKTPNLFETKFPRFSYRYKYRDGEYSTFAPFTDPVFNAKYTKDTSASSDTNVLYNKDTAYDVKEPHNKAMVNSIHSVELTNFINSRTPQDATEIEILYKQEGSTVIYSIASIKQSSKEWHAESNSEGANVGYNKDSDGENFLSIGGVTKGKYIVTTENIYAALPADQMLRPWDNVPKKALAQEITGNRVVYGNYVQNYNITEDITVTVGSDNRDNSIKSFETHGLPSVKSQRNYQLGVVYCDKYGRETPVFTSSTGAVNIPWQDEIGNKNASKSLQLAVSTPTNFPEWVDSLKFFIKENSNPYYNLLMERAWVSKKTYELDNSEGHMWLCFPSSDRNKISENDYITLKKKIGPDETQISRENKYKVIDIKNEAPDAIKYELVNLGTRINSVFYTLTHSGNGIFPSTSDAARPDVPGADTILIKKLAWDGTTSASGMANSVLTRDAHLGSANNVPVRSNLYISWRRTSSSDGRTSQKYKIAGGHATGTTYVLKLNSPITKIDADIAHKLGNASLSEGDLHADLVIQIEERRLKESEDFSGKFFVKISKNEVTDLIENGEPVPIQKQFAVTSKTSSWYWQDYSGTSAEVDFTSTNNLYGITNWNGWDVTYTGSSANHIHNSANRGGTTDEYPHGVNTTLTSKITDFAAAWKYIYESTFGPTFFVDGMHMVAGQSDASNYAKFGCITWAGCTIGDSTSAEESSWSYPPLKTWLGDNENIADKIGGASTTSAGSVWYENNMITTNINLVGDSDYNDLKVDGWIGPLQRVSRDVPTNINDNHINGIEGIVTTTTDHTKGPRRWLSGLTGSSHGVGTDTKTYADNEDDIGRHFMHLSFFAPGKDLHDGTWDGMTAGLSGTEMIYSENSFMANLQGIWGGGVFTGEDKNDTFGNTLVDEEKFQHLPMEGNYSDYSYVAQTPGPGVGYGYDIKYRELHERQWDPTFNRDGDGDNKIRDFLRNLYPGSKFRFNRTKTTSVNVVTPVVDDKVYTIKKVSIKKLYNHTSWRKPYNRYTKNAGGTASYTHPNNTSNEIFQSVEEVAMRWLNTIEDGGLISTSNNGTDTLWGKNTAVGDSGLMKKIKEFGAAHNRRVCYIIELDENPTDSESALRNPLGEDNYMNADYVNKDFCDIEFLDPVQDVLLSDLNKYPSIWEIDPKKQEVDLDIYYEASNHIPVYLDESSNELIAPIGCKVEVLNSIETSTSIVQYWENNILHVEPGFLKGTGGEEINYTGMSFKFTKADGSYNIIESGLQDLDGGTSGVKKEFVFRENIGDVIATGLSWSNCFSFGNGVESNRIRDDFNEPFISNGVKASTTTQEAYKEERRKNGLIYSGIYNSDSGINDLNQFIMAEKITKDLNPTYGSIQKLFSRDTDLVTFCEDRVVKVLANKDALYNADGNVNLVASENVLGQTIPFVGEYGISTNPESFSSESYRAYFTDKQRGSVLRLSRDGLTPISKAGMNDWFRDNLKEYNTLIGTYDNYKEHYNLTLSNNTSFNENLISDSFLRVGEELEGYVIGSLGIITNPGVFNGIPYSSLDESNIVNEYENATNPFDWASFTYNDYNFTGTVKVVHHAEIPHASIEQPLPFASPQSYVPPIYTATGTKTITNSVTGGITTSTETFTASSGSAATQLAEDAGYTLTSAPTTTFSSFTPATYKGWTNLEDDGWFYDGNFRTMSSGNLFGTTAYNTSDGQVNSRVRRWYGTSSATLLSESYTAASEKNEFEKFWGSTISAYQNSTAIIGWYSPKIEKPIYFPGKFQQTPVAINENSFSGTVTRNSGSANGKDGAITFDRGHPSALKMEIRNIGSGNLPNGDGLLDTYVTNGGDLSIDGVGNGGLVSYGTDQSGDGHDTMFNGEELYVSVTIRVYSTAGSGNSTLTGYNEIKPRIVILDGSSWVSSNVIQSSVSTSSSLTSEQQIYQKQNAAFGNLGASILSPVATSNTAYSGNKLLKSGVSNSSAVTFPLIQNNTPGITWKNSSGATATTGARSAQVRIGAAFKFRDHNQQDSSGAKISNLDNIREVKVINDLRIRIDQTKGPATAGYSSVANGSGPNASGHFPYRNQLWEVERVDIKKGYGVTKPHVNPAIATSTVTSISTVQTQVEVPLGLGQKEVLAVPPVTVPAWTQVQHVGLPNNSWQFFGGQGGSAKLAQITPQLFGPNYSAVTQTGNKRNTDLSLDPIQNYYNYVVPEDWSGLSSPSPTVNSPYGTTGSTRTIPSLGLGTHGNNYSRVISGNNSSFSLGTITCDNPYVRVGNNTQNGVVDMNFNITSNPWTTGNWYLVDIEFLEEVGTNGEPTDSAAIDPIVKYGNLSHPNGQAIVMGAAATYATSFTSGSDIDPIHGVGKYFGNNGWAHVSLVPTIRTEYGNADGTGDNKVVLRGIFKVDSSSAVIQGYLGASVGVSPNELTIRFHNMQNYLHVSRVITKKLSGSTGITNWLNTNAKANEWSATEINSSGAVATPVHAFSHRMNSKMLYYKSGKLNWEVPADQLSGTYQWSQQFGTPTTTPSPVESQLGWELTFTVSDNVHSGNPFSGVLQGFVAIDDGAGGHEGVHFDNINQTGNYAIKFNFNGDTAFYNVGDNAIGLPDKPWKFLRADLGLVPTSNFAGGTLDIASNLTAGVSNDYIDKVQFEVSDLSSTVAQEYAISDIQLTDSQSIFAGGRAGSWNFSGFDTSENNYIFWNTTKLNLHFNQCPAVGVIGDSVSFININQQITKTVKRFQKYKIRFRHSISAASTATLSIYHYNTDGYGFKIDNISSSSGVSSGDTDTYGNDVRLVEQTVVIGGLDSSGVPVAGSKWSDFNEVDPLYSPDIKNSFVISVNGAVGESIATGTIDDIEMLRVYDIPNFEDKTITFSEKVNGWTSFKSFVPENGLSVSKKYFTFDQGQLYEHYIPLIDGERYSSVIQGSSPLPFEPKEADNYNIFYNTAYSSSVTTILNNEPSLVKTFNTLSYEGSQSYVTNPSDVYVDGEAIYTASDLIDINNSEAFLAGGDILGWTCVDITTDLDVGTLQDFIKKEGKWFNYIRGKTSDINTDLFSTQGLGIIDFTAVQGQESQSGGGIY